MIIFAMQNSDNALEFFLLLVITFFAVTIALVLHELAHGLVAKWNGDYTAKYAGRLTLNPLKHFDTVGLIMMLTVGFGYAKPVPVDPTNFRHTKRGLITVSIAGIVTNIILAFLGTMLLFLVALAAGGLSSSSVVAGAFVWYVLKFFDFFIIINLNLAFFNLLPICPLDGFRLCEAILKPGNRFCSMMRTNGRYALWGLVILSFVIDAAFDRVPSLPYWFQYFDLLGMYLSFFTGKVSWLFSSFWSLIIPV